MLFFSAAPTAPNSPELHFRFINSFIQQSCVEYLCSTEDIASFLRYISKVMHQNMISQPAIHVSNVIQKLPSGLGTIHILRKHIFRLFGPTYSLVSMFYVLEISKKMQFFNPPTIPPTIAYVIYEW